MNMETIRNGVTVMYWFWVSVIAVLVVYGISRVRLFLIKRRTNG